jgi:hypothetical protein
VNAARDDGGAGGVHASVPRGRELAAKLDGTSSNRNAAAARWAASGTEHSSRAAGRESRENFADWGLGAGPRAAAPAPAAPLPPTAPVLPRLPGLLGIRWRATLLPSGPLAAAGSARGSGGIAVAAASSPVRWPDSPGNSATAATGRLPSDRLGCKSVDAVVQDGTRVHNPSADRAAPGSGNCAVASAPMQRDTEVGPRE